MQASHLRVAVAEGPGARHALARRLLPRHAGPAMHSLSQARNLSQIQFGFHNFVTNLYLDLQVPADQVPLSASEEGGRHGDVCSRARHAQHRLFCISHVDRILTGILNKFSIFIVIILRISISR